MWKLVKPNMKDMKKKDVAFWYQDETEDWITISDDDDLLLAYETAQSHFKGSLKVYAKPVY